MFRLAKFCLFFTDFVEIDAELPFICLSGLNRGMVAKDGSGMRGSSGSQQPQEQGREGGYDNEITIVEPENYYTPIMHGGDGSSLGHKEIGGEHGCSFGGRRESGLAIDLGESLRTHLSDPVT